ncbi:SUR7/PalI family-domain-containing protein [Podospora fimiseda]|uniref:SUR7/PalI family-domain-containing protein n=1 Tax=Podospora fimiseda TaxID=252190 RepID=A0AAN7H606_9PEZI|nr:SUR7/PalI family-domain-containing protein [Podospora fimiseda]
MASFGRFVCVLLPFLLTLAALVAMLIAGLAGIADKSLYMFQVNTTDLSIDPLKALDIVSKATDGQVKLPDVKGLITRDVPVAVIETRQESKSNNITAEDLGLYDLYDISVWGYCYTPQNGSRECTKASFDWATKTLNTTTGNLNSLLTSTGQNVTLPKEITDAVKVFSTASRWTQIVFIVAYVALAVELFLGLFANCSRIFSCLTWLIAAFAAVATGCAAGLATATSVIVVGAVEASAKIYGVRADFNRRFLATVWIGAAFAIGAAFFWLFTICCCAPDHSSKKKRSRQGSDEGEKLIGGGSGAYQRIGEPNQGYQGYAQQYPRQYPQQSYSGSQGREVAYEPYSHARV